MLALLLSTVLADSGSVTPTPTPTGEPLTLAELKQRADIVRDDIDGVLTSLITAGREWIETYTGLTVYADRVVQQFGAFRSPMSLLVTPVDNSPTVSYIDANGGPAELVGVRIVTTSRPARLLAPVGAMWPAGASDITVTSNGVPETFKAAITLYVRAMHEDGAISPAYQQALEALCHPYRMLVIG